MNITFLVQANNGDQSRQQNLLFLMSTEIQISQIIKKKNLFYLLISPWKHTQRPVKITYNLYFQERYIRKKDLSSFIKKNLASLNLAIAMQRSDLTSGPFSCIMTHLSSFLMALHSLSRIKFQFLLENWHS